MQVYSERSDLEEVDSKRVYLSKRRRNDSAGLEGVQMNQISKLLMIKMLSNTFEFLDNLKKCFPPFSFWITSRLGKERIKKPQENRSFLVLKPHKKDKYSDGVI